MGVDVVFKIRPADRMDEETFEEHKYRFDERFPDEFPTSGMSRKWPSMEWDPYEDAPTIEVRSLDRYYGEGYERGPWERIREMGDWLTVEFGETAEVRYGGDSADEWVYLATWPDERKKLDAHFAAVGHEPYQNAFKRYQ